MTKGKFIVFEGGEGSGKSTIIELVRLHIPADQRLITREPGGSVFGEEIRLTLFSERGKDFNPLTQFYLFSAARADHVRALILPSLNGGEHVICDRFAASTFAHQIVGAGHNELRPLFAAAQKALRKLLDPPTYIYLDIDPELGLARKKNASSGNFFDEKGLEYHRRVQEGYNEFFNNEPGVTYVDIDAGRSKEQVWDDVREVLDRVLA